MPLSKNLLLWEGDNSPQIPLDALGLSSPIQNFWLRHCVIERHSHAGYETFEYNVFP